MTERDPYDPGPEYISAMGERLGRQCAKLWEELALLHVTWAEYIELFGSKETRIELLNSAAPGFFHMIQARLWEALVLQIARLTDASRSSGHSNLTLRN